MHSTTRPKPQMQVTNSCLGPTAAQADMSHSKQAATTKSCAIYDEPLLNENAKVLAPDASSNDR